MHHRCKTILLSREPTLSASAMPWQGWFRCTHSTVGFLTSAEIMVLRQQLARTDVVLQ